MRAIHCVFCSLASLIVLGFLPVRCLAGETPVVKIRVLEALQTSQSPDPGIADVMPALQRTLRFPAYRLIAVGHCPIADGASTELEGGIAVRLSEVAGQSITIEISKKEQPLLKTKVLLVPDKPLILGGIPGTNDTPLIVVLTTA